MLIIAASCQAPSAERAAASDHAESWSAVLDAYSAIGVAEGEFSHEFDRASSPRFVNEHTIAVANGYAEIRYFTVDGKHIRTVGRRGGGPREFGQLTGLVRKGLDTLVAMDAARNRLVVIDTAGNPVRSVALPVPADFAAGIAFLPGNYVALVRADVPVVSGTPGVIRQRLSIVGLRSGRIVNQLGELPGPSWITNGHSWDGQPLTERGRIAAWRGFIAIMSADSPAIRIARASGKTEMMFSPVADLPEQVTPQMYEAWRREVRKELVRAGAPAQIGPWSDQFDTPLPQRLPYYSRMFTDDVGCLWIQRYSVPGSANRKWLIVDPLTSRAARLTIPAEFTVGDVRSGLIVGLARDQLDVQQIRFVKIARPPGSRHCN
jgi:hypothetical protein